MEDVESFWTLLWDEIVRWYQSAIKALPNLIIAILVIGIFCHLARIVSQTSRRGLRRVSQNENLNGLASGIARIAVIVLGLLIALSVLKLDKIVLSLLAGVGVVGIALGFAFQDLASNFISGVMIAFQQPFRRGDVIMMNNIMGHVLDMTLRHTVIRDFDGQDVIIPNKDFMTNAIYNYQSFPIRKIRVPVGISYGDDISSAKAAIVEELKKSPIFMGDPAPVVYAESFGDSSVNLDVQVWIEYPRQNFYQARDQVVSMIKKALEAKGVTIPFPIRTLDFEIKGGQKLKEILNLPDKGQ